MPAAAAMAVAGISFGLGRAVGHGGWLVVSDSMMFGIGVELRTLGAACGAQPNIVVEAGPETAGFGFDPLPGMD